MVSRGKSNDGAREAARAAASAMTPPNKEIPKPQGTDKIKEDKKFVSFRLPVSDYDHFQSLFRGQGVSMATAAAISIQYVAELLQADVIKLSRAGIIDIKR
jgi:hypothetical protein